jgi:hypothetical protein
VSRHILVTLACAVLIVPSLARAERARAERTRAERARAAAAPAERAPLENPTLDQVREMVDEQDFEAAQEAIARILQTGELGPPQLVEAYRAMAECSAALRRPDDATGAFVNLLAINPDFYVSSSESPLVREPFEQAQAFWSEHTRPTPSYDPPRAIPPDQPFIVAVSLDASELPALFADVRIHYRTEDGGFFTTLEAEGGAATIPQDALESAAALELYVSVHDEHGNVAAWIGSPEEPLRIAVGDDPGDEPAGPAGPGTTGRRRIYQRWWFWTIIGVAVVGLAVGLPVGLTQAGGADPCEDAIGGPCDLVVPLGQ